MLRGEVWRADLPPLSGRRPVLLLSRDEAYSIREFIIMSPVTTRSRGLRTEVSLSPVDGLPRMCVVNLDVIITESKRRFQEGITVLNPEKGMAVNEALRFALRMDD